MTVSDPQAAAVLTNPEALEWLKPFIGCALSVSEAARQEGANTNTMYGWVKRLEAVGLIRVVSEEPRKGRAIKRYRAVADTFFVPFAASPYSTLEDALAALDGAWEKEMRRLVVRARQQVVETWGYLIKRHASGTLMLTSAEGGQELDFLTGDAPAVLSSWSDLIYLTEEEAKALQRHLRGLLEAHTPSAGKKRYALRLGLAPLER